jgi:putative heme degradation protein
MNFFKKFLNRKVIAEHERLIQHNKAKAATLRTLLEVAQAQSPQPMQADSIRDLVAFETELDHLNVGRIKEGQLRPEDADALLEKLKKLGDAEAMFRAAYQKR